MTPAIIVYNCDSVNGCSLNHIYIYFILVAEWNKDPEAHFNQYWSGWDKRISETGAKKKYCIKDIGTIFDVCTYTPTHGVYAH